jgi:hypothetical protein
MTPHKETKRGPKRGRYVCATRERRYSDDGAPPCAEPGISFAVAERAVLRELMRLKGRPWQPQALEALEERDPYATERARLRTELADAERSMQHNVVALRMLGNLGEATIAAFRADAHALEARITSAKAQLAALPQRTTDVQRARAVHERLSQTDMAALVESLQAADDSVGLRELLLGTMNEAHITERQTGGPGGRSVWARARVKWSDDVQLLLDENCLGLGAAPEPPTAVDRRGRNRERMRRWRAQRRAARALSEATDK